MKNFIKDNWRWLVSLVLVVIALGLVDVQNIKIEHCVLLTIALTAGVVFPVITAIFCKCRKQRYPQTAQLISSISFVAMVLFWRLPISFYWSWLPYAILIIASAYLPNGNTNTMPISILLAFGSVYSYTSKADRLYAEYMETASSEVTQVVYVEQPKSKICSKFYSGKMILAGKGMFKVRRGIDIAGLKEGDTVKIVFYRGQIANVEID